VENFSLYDAMRNRRSPLRDREDFIRSVFLSFDRQQWNTGSVGFVKIW